VEEGFDTALRAYSTHSVFSANGALGFADSDL
jgi:hypothetical protein